MDAIFPVPEAHVPRVFLSRPKAQEWHQVAHEEVIRTVLNPHSWFFTFESKVQDGYDQIADHKDLTAFVRNVPHSALKHVLVRASVEATLDELSYALHCENTAQQRRVFAHLYGGSFLDGGIAHVAETKTKEDPFRFVGMKWIAFRSPAPAIVMSRDFLYFAYSGTTIDARGRRVLFRFMRSMAMEDVDVEERVLPHLVRGKISHLHLYVQDGNRTQVYLQALHSAAGNLPSWAATKTIAFMWPGLSNLATVADMKALTSLGMTKLYTLAGSDVWSTHSQPPTLAEVGQQRSSCRVCQRRYRMTRSKRLCVGCETVVCKKCTLRLSFFDEAKVRSPTGVTTLRFCLSCLNDARMWRFDHVYHRETPNLRVYVPEQSVVSKSYRFQDEDEESTYSWSQRSCTLAYDEFQFSRSVSTCSTSSQRLTGPESESRARAWSKHAPYEAQPQKQQPQPVRVSSEPDLVRAVRVPSTEQSPSLTLRRINSLSAEEAKDLESTFRQRVKLYYSEKS